MTDLMQPTNPVMISDDYAVDFVKSTYQGRGSDPIIRIWEWAGGWSLTPGSYYCSTLGKGDGEIHLDYGQGWKIPALTSNLIRAEARRALREAGAATRYTVSGGSDLVVVYRDLNMEHLTKIVPAPFGWDDEHTVQFVRDGVALLNRGVVVKISDRQTGRVLFDLWDADEAVLSQYDLDALEEAEAELLAAQEKGQHEPGECEDADCFAHSPNDVYRQGGVQGAN